MTGESVEVGLGLGSNIGDKAGFIRAAAERLGRAGLLQDLRLSSLYRTAPWGPVEQDWFVNACAVGTTRLPAQELLRLVKGIEAEIGRTATVRWGPRVIDIDILYYGDLLIDQPGLTVPHRHMMERAFVLVPLAELRPELRIGGVPISEAAHRLEGEDIVPIAPIEAGLGSA